MDNILNKLRFKVVDDINKESAIYFVNNNTSSIIYNIKNDRLYFISKTTTTVRGGLGGSRLITIPSGFQFEEIASDTQQEIKTHFQTIAYEDALKNIEYLPVELFYYIDTILTKEQIKTLELLKEML